MGNCQAIDTATVMIQKPNGKVEKLYWPVSANEVMNTNPGHYVALLISTTFSTSKVKDKQNCPNNSNNNINNNNLVRLTHIKLLKPTDTLVLGQVYRLFSTQEVMKGIWAKKQAKMNKNLPESAHKEKPLLENQETKDEGHGSRTTTSTNGSSTASKSRRTWQPCLHSISEASS